MSGRSTQWRTWGAAVRASGRDRPPAIADLPSAWRLLGLLFAVVGTLVIATTAVPAASSGRVSAVVQVLDVVAILAALAIALAAGRLPRVLVHVAAVLSSGLISGAVLASGGGSTALAYACAYLLVPMYCLFVLRRREAVVHLGVVVALGVPALATQPGVGPGEQVVFWGVALVLGAATSWLVGVLVDAESDSLTGLLTRPGTERALEVALAAAPEGPLAVAVLEIDRFRAVNDALGREGADRLLADTARAWRTLAPASAVLGRVRGDGFAVVLPGTGAQAASALTERLRAALPAGTTCSAGTAGWERGESASMLLSRAEAAAYAAKAAGRARTHTHPGVGADGRRLRQALERGEFVVAFQPVVDLALGAPVGAEALVRWQDPVRGLVPPGDFLPEAERSGVIVDIGEFVLTEACRRAAAWPQGPAGAPYVAVNASARELQDGAYAATVQRALEGSGLPPHRLVVELVESHFDIESVHLVANLHTLRALGVRIAIDDFGTGYSSLGRLKHLGADLLKVDRTFVADITTPDAPAPLVAAVIALARALDVAVIAEGVENAAQARWLREHGCRLGQGYHLGRPTVEAAPLEELRPAGGRQGGPAQDHARGPVPTQVRRAPR